MNVRHAGAGVGGTPRGRSSACEHRDKCPALKNQKYFPRGLWTSCVNILFLRTHTSAYVRKYQLAPLMSIYGTPGWLTLGHCCTDPGGLEPITGQSSGLQEILVLA